MANDPLSDVLRSVAHVLSGAPGLSPPADDDDSARFQAVQIALADAEARLSADDPVEGHAQPKPGPAQSMVQELLGG